MTVELLGIYVCPKCRQPFNRSEDGKIEEHTVLVPRFFSRGFDSRRCPGSGKEPSFVRTYDYVTELKERSIKKKG